MVPWRNLGVAAGAGAQAPGASRPARPRAARGEGGDIPYAHGLVGPCSGAAWAGRRRAPTAEPWCRATPPVGGGLREAVWGLGMPKGDGTPPPPPK